MTLDRPTPHTVLRAFAAESTLPVDQVLARLAALLPDASRYPGLLVVQGAWWYRAEYRVVAVDGLDLAAGGRSRIEHVLLNVASPAHWAGPITGRAVVRDAGAAFERLVAQL